MDDKTVIQPRPEGIRAGLRLNGVYEIERLVAEGGMGEVYKGFNIQTHDPVAIKTIRAELSNDPDVLALFRREASTLFKLNHDAIVRYFVFSVDPALKRAYLAMEFVDGPSLARRCAERPLSVEETRVLIARIGAALDAAHRLGIVHRDISSDNIILPGGDLRKAKLIDFGIARSQQPGQATIIGDGFAGKYNYVSPEQLGLYGGDVTGRSDLYSFGLVIAEALRGRPIDMSGSHADVLEKRRRVPDVSFAPTEFRPLLEKLLQPKPADRPETISDVSKALASSARGGRAWIPLLAAVLVIVSFSAVGYLFRDEFAGLVAFGPNRIATPSPTATESTKPPPLGGTPTTAETPSPAPAVATPSPTPTAQSSPQAASLENLLDAAPPRPPSATLELAGAIVGKPYHAAIPAFIDPSGKGLKLSAQGLPDGLSLVDQGDGSAEISGAPTKAGASTVTIVATNVRGRQGEMTAVLTVAPLSLAEPTEAEVTLSNAMVGRDFEATLPPFRPGSDEGGIMLRAEPNPPDGLTFSDAGGGLSLVSGAPKRPGKFSFDVVASDANGPGGRMTVSLTVAPAPLPAPAPTVDLVAKARAFVAGYDSGPCFFARLGAGGEPSAVEAVGAHPAAFLRFDAAYQREVGVAAKVVAQQIRPAQCPLVELLKLSAEGSATAPHIELSSPIVGPGRPLAGRVTGLAHRPLQMVVLLDDGGVFLLPSAAASDGASASFDTPASADANSAGKQQVLVAVVSEAPLTAFQHPAAKAEELVQALRGEWKGAGAVADAAYFELTR